METLYNYGNLIIISVILITITEILLPEGLIKKYSLLLTSLMISLILTLPLIKLLNKDFDFSEVFDVEFLGNENDVPIEDNIYDAQIERLETTFENKLIEELRYEFANEKYEILWVDIIFSLDSDKKIQNILSANFGISSIENGNIGEVKKRISKVSEISLEKINITVEENI